MARIRLGIVDDEIEVLPGSHGEFQLAIAKAGPPCRKCKALTDVIVLYEDNNTGVRWYECDNCGHKVHHSRVPQKGQTT